MMGIPVMDQGDTNTCYAYAGSQLYDALRFAHQAPPRLDQLNSPLATAVNHAVRFGKGDGIAHGDVSEAVYNLNAEGGCSYSKVGDQIGTYKFDGFLKELKTYFETIESLTSAQAEQRQAELGNLQCFLAKKDVFDQVIDLRLLSAAVERHSFDLYLKKIIDTICMNDPIRFRQIEVTEDSGPPLSPVARAAYYRSLLDRRMDSPTAQPAAISYCSSIIDDSNATPVSDPNVQPADKCLYHASVVVGRRVSPAGQCQLLVRNAWGTSCNSYTQWDCENGQVWIDEDKLLQFVTKTTALQ